MDCVCQDCHEHFIAQNEFENECFNCWEKKHCLPPPVVNFEPLELDPELLLDGAQCLT